MDIYTFFVKIVIRYQEEDMNIIIVGCGKVGYALAEQLNEEGHEITIIDTNNDKLEKALSILDIQGVNGNGTSFRTQMEAGIKESDLLIAVTGQDEVNLLCCLIAKKAGNCNTIARVRNPEYFAEIKYLREELGLSLAINPELACAMGIARLISPRSYNKQKGEAYECGIPTRGKSWMQFKVGYYLFAILFLMFDVETV